MPRKEDQLSHLHSFLANLPTDALATLVAHRGFHCRTDALSRPVENTLEAFISAWKAGFSLCECDVTTTKDGKLVFGHDKTFERLALVKDCLHRTRVEQLTSADLEKLKLIDNSGALYFDRVLEELLNYENAQLVVEAKSSADSERFTEALWENLASLDCANAKIPLVMSFKPSLVFKVQQKLQTMLSNTEKPLVMLLVERPKKIPTELRQHVNPKYKDFKMRSRWIDLTSEDVTGFVLKNCLTLEDTQLDGLYLQFDSRMLESGIVRTNLQRMCQQFVVGVFLGKSDTDFDKLETFTSLKEVGVSFFNTDVPPTGFF